MKMFARDIIEAAKSDKCFDKVNAEQIANDHGQDPKWILKEIKFVRKNLRSIDPE